jgi:hypothetical protein
VVGFHLVKLEVLATDRPDALLPLVCLPLSENRLIRAVLPAQIGFKSAEVA